jgi:pimeloyl-ACP methyl ester carboxylesterase
MQIFSRKFSSQLLASLLIAITAGGCAFSKLEDDLAQYEKVDTKFSGSVTLEGVESDSIVVTALFDNDGQDLYSFRVLAGPGDFHFKGAQKPLWFFAFDDKNKDLKFQPGEPHGRNMPAGPVVPTSNLTENIAITIKPNSSAQQGYPAGLVNYPLSTRLGEQGIYFTVGTVTALDSELFSAEQAKKGLWQPYAFMVDGGAGVHFLEEYDPDRIPVIFVHGISGSPQNFKPNIESLDQSRYQVWVYSYPSGMRLTDIANGLYEFFRILDSVYNVEEIHMVAHSMGGLVARGTINVCAATTRCSDLVSFTTISTPWAGVASAKSGVEWSPTVVPVWRDMDPDSDYLKTLFDTPLPQGLPHYLFFGFKQDSIFGSGSSDGTIKLTSQLRPEAQAESSRMRGLDEGHVSILSNEFVLGDIAAILDANSQ